MQAQPAEPCILEGLGARRAAPFARLFQLLLVIALLSLAIGAGGRWAGRFVAADGHTESRAEREILIGNNVLLVPENIIRFAHSRRDGEQPRLDLYLRWPDLRGYTRATRDDFNHAGDARRIVFASFEPRRISRDMSGRLDPIYRHLLEPSAEEGPAGLSLHRFREDAGYVGEVLAVGLRAQREPFVARCLTGETAARSLAACERDVHLGRDLTLVYRFPETMLADWRRLDDAIMARVDELLQTD